MSSAFINGVKISGRKSRDLLFNSKAVAKACQFVKILVLDNY